MGQYSRCYFYLQNLHSGTWFLQQAGSSAFSMILELTSVCYNVIVLICIFAFNSSKSSIYFKELTLASRALPCFVLSISHLK